MSTQIIEITDPELGIISEENIDETVLAIEEITSQEGKATTYKNIGQEDIAEYREAWEKADVGALESLRDKHPEDARFSLHLAISGISLNEAQPFQEVNANHKDLIDKMGLASAPQFLKLLEEGNPKKTRKYIEQIPESDPLKKDYEAFYPFL